MNIAFVLWCLVVKIVKISKDSWSRDSADILLTSLGAYLMSIMVLSTVRSTQPDQQSKKVCVLSRSLKVRKSKCSFLSLRLLTDPL